MDFAQQLQGWLQSLGLSEKIAVLASDGLEILLIAGFACIAAVITRRIVQRVVKGVAKRTKTEWDDALVRRRVFHRLSHLAPALVIYALAPAALESAALVEWVRKGSQIYMLLVGVVTVDAVLNAGNDIFR